jgi:hypothetical protein
LQFYCIKNGGIKDPETQELRILEGTAEKGPWYNAEQFSDYEIGRWTKMGYIKIMEKEVK